MPTEVIPLIGSIDSRGFAPTLGTSAKDQQFINAIFDVVANPITKSGRNYLSKIGGNGPGSNFDLSNPNRIPQAIESDNDFELFFYTESGQKSGVYSGSTYCGTFDTNEIIRNNTRYVVTGEANAVQYVAFLGFNVSSGLSYGYFIFDDAISGGKTFTANTTISDPTLTSVSSTAGCYVGQELSGTGIAGGTRILSIDSATQITMNANATANGTGVTITRTAMSKIIDADFPSDVSGLAYLDGYLFAGTASGKIFQSAINNPASWAASDYLVTSAATEVSSLLSYGDMIIASGNDSWEFFRNAGNPYGSVLTSIPGSTRKYAPIVDKFCVLNGIVYFTAQSTGRRGGPGFYAFMGNEVRKLSVPPIDYIILQNNLRNCYVLEFDGGRPMIVLMDANGSGSANPLVYDPDHRIFSVLSIGTMTGARENVFTLNATATYHSLTTASYTNNATIQTTRLNHGTNRFKRVNWVRLLSDVQASGTATLSYSDDDYATWTTAGTFDMTSTDPRVFGCGGFRGYRAWKIAHSAATAFRCSAIEINYDVGAT